jgi:hypothetical protein
MVARGAQIERDEELHTFQAISNRFRFPYEQSLSTNPLYYSLDVGPIHVVMLNAVRPRAPRARSADASRRARSRVSHGLAVGCVNIAFGMHCSVACPPAGGAASAADGRGAV